MSVASNSANVSREDSILIPVDALHFADSARLEGESADHIRTLAEAGDDLPPILVHLGTNRVIDGMHRLQAAMLNGQKSIRARYFDGSKKDAFVVGVRANIRHGLPLSRSDREAAAARILASHPQWSDRAIAEVAGLASTTVARIRSRSTDKDAQQDVRIGRDGRSRPLNGAAGRRLAGQLIATHPDASLREIAETVGISPATAKDVRDRLQRGDDPVPAKLMLAERKSQDALEDRRKSPVVGRLRRPNTAPDAALVLQKLQRDPSLRLNDEGRLLLRWLNSHSINSEEWEGFEPRIPAHCILLVADVALGFAEEWVHLADALRRRARTETA
jgi:ParB-like chromosome segregation protein Spo0J